MYNRKERRTFSKGIGLNKEKIARKNKISYFEILQRSILAGKQIFRQNKEEMLNIQLKMDMDVEVKNAEYLMSDVLDSKGKIISKGLTEEETIKIIEKNLSLTEKREGELQKRRKSQYQKIKK